MYFRDEPLNDKDMLISTMAGGYRDGALVTCTALPEREALVPQFAWDIVLLQG